jgi:hypothetical protein
VAASVLALIAPLSVSVSASASPPPAAVPAAVPAAPSPAAVPATPIARAAPLAGPRPWAANVSAERQADAYRLFEQGNHAFEESKYGEALASYREAIAFWDHPVIHFNMAVCLIHLDQPVAAYDHLSRALRYGAGPLGGELHSQGLTYDKLLSGRLARIRISCEQPGVEVSLDGRPILTCPSSGTHVVLPGLHQIVARRPGYLTDARDVNLLPGKLQHDRIALVEVKATTVVARRWRAWVPWAVVGSGAAVAAVGYGLHRRATASYGDYDRAFSSACPAGCVPADVPDDVSGIGRRASRENDIAVGAISAGAVIAGAGTVLLFLNQPRAVSGDEQSRRARTARVGAMLNGQAAGVALTLPF